jgi:glycosyltransferase involved in cell wall biosynthesis
MQYIHSHYDEYTHKLRWFTWWLFTKVRHYLLKRDLKARYYDTVYANSQYTADLARELYDLESTVIYPAINDIFFDITISSRPAKYWVATGRLVRLVKEFDRIIELFNQKKLPLLVLWSWPDESYLKSIAGSTITFLWWVSDDNERAEILRHAAWFINITKESFWIATAEALLCGVPVLWYDQGGTSELVDKLSWILVGDKSLVSLLDGMDRFEQQDFDRTAIQSAARDFFSTEIRL